MRKIKLPIRPLISLVAMIVAVLFFTACPDEMIYPPGYPDQEKIDPQLIGTWHTRDSGPDVQEVKISKASEYSYRVEALITSEDYNVGTNLYTMWVTKIGKDKFLYAKADNKEIYYVYHYKFDGKKKFELSQLNYLIEGKDGITSTESFRKEIELSMKLGGCLRDMLVYSRE